MQLWSKFPIRDAVMRVVQKRSKRVSPAAAFTLLKSLDEGGNFALTRSQVLQIQK
jgi:hypothetical protein